MRTIKSKFKKPDLNTRIGKYYMAVQKGKTKKEAQIVAGFNQDTNATRIERTKEFQSLQTYFKDELIQKITMGEIADALTDNIRQSGEIKIDRNARNRAIEIALARIEPKDAIVDGSGDKVLIVLSK